MEPSVQWLVIGAAGVVALGMVVRGLLRLRGSGAPFDRAPSRVDGAGGLSKIERIKRYREQHGVGLKEAKEAVEAEEAGRPWVSPARKDVAPQSVEALIERGQLIQAIKLYREQHGVDLKQAKEAVEAMRDRRRG